MEVRSKMRRRPGNGELIADEQGVGVENVCDVLVGLEGSRSRSVVLILVPK